jgi:CheY-like chemotaxis protein
MSFFMAVLPYGILSGQGGTPGDFRGAMSQSKALEALFPGPRRTILCAIFHAPERWWSLLELAGRAGIRPGSLRPHLRQLREGGLIRQRADGGRAWFQADSGSPVFADVHSIVTKLTARERGETILIVEDQMATAQITRILLESWGYRVLEAHSGPEALEVFEHNSDAIELLLTDVIMPGLGGVQLAEDLARRKPELRIVYMSGYPAEQLDGGHAAFLPKPFNPAGLARTVRKELDRCTRKMKSP